VLLLGVLGCKPAPQPDANPSSFGSRPEVDAAVLDIMESDRVPGVAVCTLVDGLTEWCQGYGWAHIEDQRQVSEDTPFLIASVSKLITGEAARQTLDASATVDVGFTVGHPGNGEMTHQMLATHTAGISDNWDVLEGYYVDGDSPIALGDFLFEYLDPSGSDYDDWENFGAPPGTEYDYSNVGAALLGYAVEVETGTDFSDWCDTEIFQPWGMTNTSWRLAALDEDTLAMPYTGLFSTDEAGHYGFPDYPDGGLRSSAVDMALFLEATVDLEHSELVPQLESGQGWVWYSWEVEGQTIWGHNGGETGVSTEVGMLEDGRGFVVLMNGEGGPNTLEDIEVAILGL
jgi:CubicO group peptidase (beta-lactamase class C family)